MAAWPAAGAPAAGAAAACAIAPSAGASSQGNRPHGLHAPLVRLPPLPLRPAVSRVLTGGVCDRWGPRAAAATIQLLTASASFGQRGNSAPARQCQCNVALWPVPSSLPLNAPVHRLLHASGALCLRPLCRPRLPGAGMAVVGDGTGYITARLFIGFSLASFVACQFWCSVMFNARCLLHSLYLMGVCCGTKQRAGCSPNRKARERHGLVRLPPTPAGILPLPPTLQDCGHCQRGGRGLGQLGGGCRAAGHASLAGGGRAGRAPQGVVAVLHAPALRVHIHHSSNHSMAQCAAVRPELPTPPARPALPCPAPALPPAPCRRRCPGPSPTLSPGAAAT